MKLTVSIREATSRDIPSILDLAKSSPFAAHWSADKYAQLFSKDRIVENLLIVAVATGAGSLSDSDPVLDSTILGFLIARHLAPEWELENIVVASTARRMGIGKQLLNALLAAARETNSEAVFLEVRDSNSAARALYEQSGFKSQGRRKSYYSNPSEDAILYRLTLPKPISS